MPGASWQQRAAACRTQRPGFADEARCQTSVPRLIALPDDRRPVLQPAQRTPSRARRRQPGQRSSSRHEYGWRRVSPCRRAGPGGQNGAQLISRVGFHMHGSVPTRADKLREGKGIMTVILVDLRRRHNRVSMARLDADHGHAGGAQRINQPRRERAGLDADPRIQSGWARIVCARMVGSVAHLPRQTRFPSASTTHRWVKRWETSKPTNKDMTTSWSSHSAHAREPSSECRHNPAPPAITGCP